MQPVGILTEKNLSLELADKLAQSAIQACSANNYNVAVTVVDRAGIPLVIKKMDNAGPHTVEASRMKAFTALTTKKPHRKCDEKCPDQRRGRKSA
ncbi:Domain of uncharacterised function (DUF336) [Serratia fonticola]|uniref:Domain of uncharacterized function (DUF336) n=1 Tax=Serratia fonticola TaxID=47917 RepID=A0A4U9TY80_SERFO|nr:Domain of uncharacterised function (DUF336) [Serratia fonticola]